MPNDTRISICNLQSAIRIRLLLSCKGSRHCPRIRPRHEAASNPKNTRMAIDLYAPCPCGSGKKFKWCCQPIHVKIDKAFQQDVDGQHEAALRLMDEVTAEHAGNPEAWGRKAQLLYENDRVDDAEK